MTKKELSGRILVGITGWKDEHWQSKVEEAKKYKIKEAALFLEMYKEEHRKKIYPTLLKSGINKIPLVHSRNDLHRWELGFLKKKFGTEHFTIHESSFKYLKKWNGFNKSLYLEMNADNRIPKKVKMEQIGGFCVDLAHFMIQKKSKTKEYNYIIQRNHIKKYFKCNHISGYSYEKNKDLHTVTSTKQFDYLKELPGFLFGKIMAIETFNNIKEQIKFKKHIEKILAQKLLNKEY